MANERKRKLRLEIAHVLFMDIVGYSRRSIDEQHQLIERLNAVVQGTEAFREAESAQRLAKLPTGDGMALIFFDSPEAPVECASEISRALDGQNLPLRMGINSGPISGVVDVNGRANVAGEGINLAQRVMDCGDAGHILLSKRVADDLAQFKHWRPHLHDLGECEVKHGKRVGLVNFFTSEIGNSDRPAKLDETPISAAAKARDPGKFVVRRRMWLIAAAALALVAIASGLIFAPRIFRSGASRIAIASPEKTAPEKSIAVLPFENLSEEKTNAYFADGIQDEILTDLSKIADLKVISRSSVSKYRADASRNLREIGQQLGVAHLLEGSVQRSEKRVRVNAQLIDARTDAHLWAQTYDRDLDDVFAIQSEIANAIAAQLQTKIAPTLKAQLAEKSTASTEAYLAYLRANETIHVAASKADAIRADELYGEAISLDPKFALAYARAGMLNSLMYSIGREAERKERAVRLVAEAPKLGETQLAAALLSFLVDRDYAKAIEQLKIARASLPNNAELLDTLGSIYRRQGKWADALEAFARAQQLDPRSAYFGGLAETLSALRRWPEAGKEFERGVGLEPGIADGWIGLAYVRFA